MLSGPALDTGGLGTADIDAHAKQWFVNMFMCAFKCNTIFIIWYNALVT